MADGTLTPPTPWEAGPRSAKNFHAHRSDPRLSRSSDVPQPKGAQMFKFRKSSSPRPRSSRSAPPLTPLRRGGRGTDPARARSALTRTISASRKSIVRRADMARPTNRRAAAPITASRTSVSSAPTASARIEAAPPSTAWRGRTPGSPNRADVRVGSYLFIRRHRAASQSSSPTGSVGRS